MVNVKMYTKPKGMPRMRTNVFIRDLFYIYIYTNNMN